MSSSDDSSSISDMPRFSNPLPFVIAQVTVCSLAIVASVLIIITISRNKLLSTKRNLLIRNWCLADILFLMCEPYKYALVLNTANIKVSYKFTLALVHIRMLSQALEMVFVFLFFVDCIYKKFNNVTLKKTLIGLWTSYAICFIITLVDDIYFGWHIPVFLHMVTFLILVVTFLVKCFLYIIRRARSKPLNSQLRFILTTGYICCWIMSFTLGAIIILVDNNVYTTSLHKTFILLALFSPVIQFILLIIFDQDFKIGFYKLIKRNEENSEAVEFQREQNAEHDFKLITDVNAI